MGRFWVRAVSLLALAALVPACGGGGGGGGISSILNSDSATGAAGGGGIAHATGAAAGVTGGAGGAVQIFSSGDINVGHGAGVVAPILPPVPTFGNTVTAAALIAASPTFTAANGNAIISANVQLPSAGGPFTINVFSGDLVISGSITSGDVGAGASDSLVINVLNGSCYITGSVRTFNTDGTLSRDNAGSLTINAQRIIVTGTIDTHGEGGGVGFPGNNGGPVTLNTTGANEGTDIYVTGTINTSGGNVTSTDADGGNGGTIAMTANGNIYAIGVTVTATGGNGQNGVTNLDADPFGGIGGSLSFSAPAGVWTSGLFDLRGGSAVSALASANGFRGGNVSVNVATGFSGPAVILGTFLQSGGNATAATGTVVAGNGGSFTIGAQTPTGAPSYVEIPGGVWDRTGGASTGTGTTQTGGAGGVVTLSSRYTTFPTTASLTIVGGVNVTGGAGATVGGAGGSILYEVGLGDILVNGTQTLTGGDAGTTPGIGGSFNINYFSGISGHLTFSGSVTANGGAATAGNVAGAVGGTITASTTTGVFGGQDDNLFSFQPGFNLTANGGAGHGTGNGGTAGTITIDNEGDIALASGAINAVGGASTGGTGGAGGFVFVTADTSLGGAGGNITVLSGNVITASGGAGVTGGNARNDGIAASVVGNTAVTLIASAGGTLGTSGNLTFNGSIVAKGGAGTTLGQGGDILFQGVNGPILAAAATVLTGTPAGDFAGN